MFSGTVATSDVVGVNIESVVPYKWEFSLRCNVAEVCIVPEVASKS